MFSRLFVSLLITFSINKRNNALESTKKYRRIPRRASKERGEEVARQLQPRIVGGSTAQIGSYQYYGALNRFPPGCGASLVSSQFMITAAHCVEYFIEALDYVNLAEVIVGVACYDREKGK